MRPVRTVVEEKGEYEPEAAAEGKTYREKKIQIQELFGSAKQQRAIKKNSAKEQLKIICLNIEIYFTLNIKIISLLRFAGFFGHINWVH